MEPREDERLLPIEYPEPDRGMLLSCQKQKSWTRALETIFYEHRFQPVLGQRNGKSSDESPIKDRKHV